MYSKHPPGSQGYYDSDGSNGSAGSCNSESSTRSSSTSSKSEPANGLGGGGCGEDGDSNFRSTLLSCIQYPGEMLFLPRLWGHATVNLDEVVGIAVEFDGLAYTL